MWIYDYELLEPIVGDARLNLTKHENITEFWDWQLVKYDIFEKVALTSVVSTITILALCGNFLTIGVVLKRKQRPLFGTCLISLAISDIFYVSGTSPYYISQFVKQSASLWYLGNTMCRLVPFLQNLTIMANSFTLVMIAFDRYMALNKLIKGKWEPGAVECSILFLFIWAIAGGISSSALWNYRNYPVRIYITPTNPEDIEIEYYDSHMCVANKEVNGRYYVLVFAFVFVPTTLVFIWLNTIIATEIWERRKAVQKKTNSTRRQSELSGDHSGGDRNEIDTAVEGNYRTMTTTITNATTTATNKTQTISSNSTVATPNNICIAAQTMTSTKSMVAPNDVYKSSLRTQRETRHIRMFKVIMCLIAVFLVCRLPNWIFLLYKLHTNIKAHKFWLLQYSLGILALCNCMLNPLMYTFLSETLKFGDWLKERVKGCFSTCTCKFKKNMDSLSESTDSTIKHEQYKGKGSRTS